MCLQVTNSARDIIEIELDTWGARLDAASSPPSVRSRVVDHLDAQFKLPATLWIPSGVIPFTGSAEFAGVGGGNAAGH